MDDERCPGGVVVVGPDTSSKACNLTCMVLVDSPYMYAERTSSRLEGLGGERTETAKDDVDGRGSAMTEVDIDVKKCQDGEENKE